ncbi:MAG: translation factor Sua5, partial [Acidimicrobiaceae bacterium]|nr:translation factor Sua5 [Acidimicrobiaceae bacterium]
MTGGRVLSTRTLEQRENAVDAALSALRRGEPVGVPTDTVYGLAADAADADAIQQLFELKERPAERSIAVLVADLAAAE